MNCFGCIQFRTDVFALCYAVKNIHNLIRAFTTHIEQYRIIHKIRMHLKCRQNS